MATTPDDYPANSGTSGLLTLTASSNGRFERGFDVDWYAIGLQAGTTYLFSLFATTGYIPYSTGYSAYALAVYGANGKPVTGLLPGSDIDGPVLEYTPAVSGTFYVAATSNYYWDALGGYGLRAAIRIGGDDHPDDATTSAVILAGGTVSGNFEVAGDTDWIRFHADVGVHYQFSAIGPGPGEVSTTGAVFPSYLSIVDAAGVRQAGARFDPTVSGDYYLDVLGLRAGNYQLVSKTWHDDYPANNTTPGILAPGGQMDGSIEYEQDVDRVKVSLEAQKFYTFTLTGEYNYFSLDLVDGQGVRQAQVSGNNGNGGLKLIFHPLASGDYYLDVGHMLMTQPQVNAIPYTVKLGTGIADDVGDTPATATRTAVGTVATGVLQAYVDVDTYRVNLHAGTAYAFAIQANDGAEHYLSLALSLADGKYISRVTDSSSGLSWRASGLERWLIFTPAADGDYYLNVQTGGAGETAYSVKALQLTGDVTGPSLIAESIAPGATEVQLTDTTITLTFSEPIVVDMSSITLKDAKGNSPTFTYDSNAGGNSPIVIDNKLVIKVQDVFRPGTYTLSFPHAAVKDLAGNLHTGPETLTFTTIFPPAAGTGGNDVLNGGSGAMIDGGAGLDTVMYEYGAYNYAIVRDGTAVTVHSNSTGKTDTLVNVERLLLGREAYALDIEGTAGQAYRLYQAAFHRTPDSAGLGFWIAFMDKGMGLGTVAHYFVDSPEFSSLYGAAPSDADFINLLYNNVLHRPAENAGFEFWEHALHNGTSHAEALVYFSESPENKAALIELIGNGFTFTPH